jgi:hypothetical protein
MLDGLLWATVHEKAIFRKDGSVRYIVLERHRLTGRTRVLHPEFERVFKPPTDGDRA